MGWEGEEGTSRPSVIFPGWVVFPNAVHDTLPDLVPGPPKGAGQILSKGNGAPCTPRLSVLSSYHP
jgi:hypothetical protein